jgi:uncharacterized NAD(P)/FAD-binding protein YdhS
LTETLAKAAPYGVAIIGAGFSGLLLALRLLRRAPPSVTIALIERTAGFGLGVAYRTQNPRHLLNVRVGNMSALPDEPSHLEAWLAREGHRAAPDAFISRETYGRYLQAMLGDAIASPDGAARLILIPDEAVRLAPSEGEVRVTLAMGAEIEARSAVLAVGSPGSAPPSEDLRHLPASLYAADPWSACALGDLSPDAEVLIIGSGLTAIDVTLALESRGHRGGVLILSRHGLAPHSHGVGWPAPTTTTPPHPPLSRLVRSVRRRAVEVGWRAAVDELRPHTQTLWRTASRAERGRFLRHLRPWWDVHRHRMAPAVASRVDALRRGGWLTIGAGEIVSADREGDLVRIAWRPRGASGVTEARFSRVIDCTGPGLRFEGQRAALLRELVDQGAARIDDLRLGLDVDADGRLVAGDGRPQARLSALGPITRGAFWESIAVPDIRNQAIDLADRLMAELTSDRAERPSGSRD